MQAHRYRAMHTEKQIQILRNAQTQRNTGPDKDIQTQTETDTERTQANKYQQRYTPKDIDRYRQNKKDTPGINK